MAFVSVTLCVERISFIKKGCYRNEEKSSFSSGESGKAGFMPRSCLWFRKFSLSFAGMAFGMQLSQRLSQSLVLAPQLQQSLALLQAPTLELKALVAAELEQNPVLEEVMDSDADLREK